MSPRLNTKGIRTAAYEYIARRHVRRTRKKTGGSKTGRARGRCATIHDSTKKRSPQTAMREAGRFPGKAAAMTHRSVAAIATANTATGAPAMSPRPPARNPTPTEHRIIETTLLIRREWPTSQPSACRVVTKTRFWPMATASDCRRSRLERDHGGASSKPLGTSVLYGATRRKKLRQAGRYNTVVTAGGGPA